MKKIIHEIYHNPLAKGSFVIFVGATVSNFGAYLYHLFMGRMLGPVSYGVLTALISLLYIIFVPALTLGTTVVKFASTAKAKKDYAQIYSLFYGLSQKLLVASLVIFLLFIFASKIVAEFLQIPNQSLIILTGSLFLFSLLPTVNNSILQAFLNFPFLAVNSIFATILKLTFAVVLVRLGFSVGGAIFALLISSTGAYLLSFYPLRFLWQAKPNTVRLDWLKIFLYAAPTFLVVLGLTSLYTTDIILVKHFFPSLETGFYASLAVMGKIIFYAGSAITVVMFPLVSERYESGGHYQSLLAQSLILVSLIAVGITGFYFLFPTLMIEVLYGSSYLPASPYLGMFGIFISLYSLSSVLTNFFLSIRKTRVAVVVLSAALAQIFLISFFHTSIAQVIQISILVTTLLLASLLVYYFRSEKA